MKTNKIIDSVEWTLTEDAIKDSALEPIDLNVLSTLDNILDLERREDDNGYMPFLISVHERPETKGKNNKRKKQDKEQKKEENTLQEIMKEEGCNVSRWTLLRSVKKLNQLGYISLIRGNYRQKSCPKFKILKGTYLPVSNNRVTNNDSDNCSIIAPVNDEPVNDDIENNVITNNESDSCSVIAPIIDDVEKSDVVTNNESGSCSVIAPNIHTDILLRNVSEEECMDVVCDKGESKDDVSESDADGQQTEDIDDNAAAASADTATADGQPAKNDKTFSKHQQSILDNALLNAVLLRDGWMTDYEWESYRTRLQGDLTSFDRGQQWTSRVLKRLGEIANTSPSYRDDISRRVLTEQQADAMEYVDILLKTKISERKSLNWGDQCRYNSKFSVFADDSRYGSDYTKRIWQRLGVRIASESGNNLMK